MSRPPLLGEEGSVLAGKTSSKKQGNYSAHTLQAAYSPPPRGGVAAPLRRCREASEAAQTAGGARAKRERDSPKHQAIGRSDKEKVVTHKPCLERIRKYGL